MRYTPNKNDPDSAVNHDLTQTQEYLYWQTFALEEAAAALNGQFQAAEDPYADLQYISEPYYAAEVYDPAWGKNVIVLRVDPGPRIGGLLAVYASSVTVNGETAEIVREQESGLPHGAIYEFSVGFDIPAEDIWEITCTMQMMRTDGTVVEQTFALPFQNGLPQ